MPARPQHRLFTVEHFAAYTSKLVLDTGDHWQLEDFQGQIAESILDPVRALMEGKATNRSAEVWAILPEGNAKTSLLAGMGLYMTDFTPLPWIPIGASTRDQAEILAQQAYQMIRMSPGMLKRFRIYEGYRRIQPIRSDHPAPGRRGLKVIAADVATGDGVIPFPIAICDEGHRHPDMRLYQLWTGKLLKRGGVIVMISTAGTPGHEFEKLRDAIRAKATERERDGSHFIFRKGERMTMHEWKVEKPADASDMEKVKGANPLSTITVEALREQFDSPTLDIGAWMRLKCNVAVRANNAAIHDSEWDDREMDMRIPVGFHIGLGLDVAWKHDTFAIVPCAKVKTPTERFRLLGDPAILTPPRDGSMLHPDFAKHALTEFLDNYVVDEAVMDTSRAEEIAAWLEDQGVRVIDWPQNNSQAAQDFEHFTKGLRTGALRHTGNHALRTHVLNAIARALPGDKRRFDRPTAARSRKHDDERVIDALAAASFINSYYSVEKPALSVADYRIQAL